MKLTQRLMTDNDKNGNPRRVWVVYVQSNFSSNFSIEAVYDEGYGGRPKDLDKMPELPTVWIHPSEYKTYRKLPVTQYSA